MLQRGWEVCSQFVSLLLAGPNFHRARTISWWRHQTKNFPRYSPFVRVIHRWPVDFPHKGQWRGALMFSLICAWTNSWTNNQDAGDLRRHRAHYDVIVMCGGTHAPNLWEEAAGVSSVTFAFKTNPKHRIRISASQHHEILRVDSP